VCRISTGYRSSTVLPVKHSGRGVVYVYNGNRTRTGVLRYRSSTVVIQVYMYSTVVLG
jgi:hypothetical protein